MKMKKLRVSALLRPALASMVGLSVVVSAHAVDIDPGDWTAPPVGSNLLLLYAQHANRNALYADGRATPNAKLGSDVLVLRYVRPIDVSGYVVAPQVLLPSASLNAGGVVDSLGKASGVSDLILASPIWFKKADAVSRNSFAFAPYLFLPTGEYEKGRALNIGENRWRAVLQFGGAYQIAKNVDLEGSIDAMIFGKNKDYGAKGTDTLKQKPLYQLQGSVNWHHSPGTVLALGLSHAFGGVQKVNSVSLGNDIATTKMVLTASTFVTPSVQLMVSAGRDLKVENGFKESGRLNLRLLKVF